MLLNKPSLRLSPIGREGRFVGKLTVTYPEFTLLIKIKISASLNRADMKSAPTNRVLQKFQAACNLSPPPSGGGGLGCGWYIAALTPSPALPFHRGRE
ncbi:hypothetical protein SAMN02746062_00111 [Alysiella filiformis DSM 16848]|uniref:Uncharacterized protein n=1 Tax=Alysiella filiformis DSM 16848 TaxID=1120981 RepID=A0A286E1Z8_9NEIS|nr:hypothetical protein SAMN02746062_00111 [Alysiella filiformis DSM 16848]